MIHKIRKLEKLIIDRKATLVDEDGAPLKKVQVAANKPSTSSPCTSSKNVGNPFSKVGEVVVNDSDEDKVLEPDNDMAKFLASFVGYHVLEDYFDDDYAAQVYDLPGQLNVYCDMYDVKLQGRDR